MDIANANGNIMNEICRELKRRRARDGFSYRAWHAGQNDPKNPSTWDLPVRHTTTWISALCIIQYLRTFPQYLNVLDEFNISIDEGLLFGISDARHQ